MAEQQKQKKNGVAWFLEKSYLGGLYGQREWYWHTHEGKKIVASHLELPVTISPSAQVKFVPTPVIAPTQTPALVQVPVSVPVSIKEVDHSWVSYIKRVTNCKRCPRECLAEKGHAFHDYKYDKKLPLNILCVSDYPRRTENAEFALMGAEQRSLLDKMMEAIGQKEENWDLTLSFKCPPSESQTDVPTEHLQDCFKNLSEEILHLRPKLIISFGATATSLLLGKKERLAIVHGQFFNQNFKLGRGHFAGWVVPLFHLDYLLINPQMKRAVWRDLQKIRDWLNASR